MRLTDDKIIFVTGASRSGTTLLSFILRNNSKIFGLREMHYFGESWDPRDSVSDMSRARMIEASANMLARQEQGILAAKPTKNDLATAAGIVDSMPADDNGPAALFMATVRHLMDGSGKSIACEQTPRNIFYARELLQAYPNAVVVHMLRDPRAVMASQKRRWQRRSLATDAKRFPLLQSIRVWVNYHPYTIARLWARATRAAGALGDHPRFKVVRFEDLLANPAETVRKLAEAIEIDFEDAMLDVGQVNSSHESSVGGAKKGINKEAIEAWRKVLTPAEMAITERICAAGLAKSGYSVPAQARPVSELRYRLTYLLHVAGVLVINPRRAVIQLKALLGKQGPAVTTATEAGVDKTQPKATGKA